MGTRINVLVKHRLPDHRDSGSVLQRLASALPAALAVRDYWRTTDPDFPHDGRSEWLAEPEPSEPHLHRYSGPGNLWLTITERAARIRTGGRWRGLIDIEALRRVHLAAFRSIVTAFGSPCMALYPDCSEADDLFWDGRSFEDVIDLLERMNGQPSLNVEDVRPLHATRVFRVWFLVAVEQ